MRRRVRERRLFLPFATVGAALACLGCALALQAGPARAATVTRTGTLQATVVDFRDGGSSTRYRLRSGRRETVVQPTELRAEPGDQVAVTGELWGDRLVGAVRATSASAQPRTIAPGPRKTAVLLFAFSGEPAEPWPAQESRSEVFTAADSASAFYAEESYGAISLTGKLRSDGDVFGWLRVDASTAGCAFEAWRDAASKAAADAGIDLSGYQHVIYEFPYQSSCSTTLGLAALGGNWVMVNGNLFGFRHQTTIHELGHNLGLLHAGSWTCTAGGVRVQVSDTCTIAGYGDPFDAMGNISTRHNSGWNLAKMGILTAANVETVEASGAYTLHSALHPTTEPTLLRIPRARDVHGNVTSWYCLEIRQTGGVFENVSDASTSGVSIRVIRPGLSPETLLLDANPATATFDDAPLGAGETLDAGPVRVTTQSAGGGSATVSVELDSQPPTPPTGLTASAGVEEVRLRWSPSSDDFGVNRYVVYRDGVEVGAVEGTSYRDSPVPLGDHEYVVYAEDVSGNRSAASAPAEVTVVPDEEPPTAPTDLTATAVAAGVQLRWSASTDNFGVDHYVVYRDGSPAGSATGTSFLDSLAPAGSHEYVVYAQDVTGNRSAASEAATATVAPVSGPTCGGGTCTVVYRYAGAAATWTVPPGVGAARFEVGGARGGSDNPEAIFGRGARVVAKIGSLAAGEEVTVSVGGIGRPDAEGGAGGFNGGGSGGLGGGGGGFSSVEIGSTLQLLAGGGGGDGADGFDSVTEEAVAGGKGGGSGKGGVPGWVGGAADAHGATLGGAGGGAAGGDGGAGGTRGEVTGSSTCAGGASAGAIGAAGDEFSGGGGASGAGGGGGGGYVGGGQGGGGARDECGDSAGAGGGGGGSSYAAPGLSAEFTSSIQRGDGQVSIDYANPVGAIAHSYTTEPGQTLVVPAASGVLSGAGLGPDLLSASVATPTAHGALTLDADGSFAYLPEPGYAGADSFSYRATDSAGDDETATVGLTVARPPSASISTPLAGGTYRLNQVASASFSCAEGAGGPGISSCIGTAAAGTPIDTSTVGSHEFTVTATSEDGLDGSARVTYTVEAPVPVVEMPGPPPVVETPAPPAPPSSPLAVAIRSAGGLVFHGAVRVRLGCRGGAPGDVCAGTLALATAGPSKRARHRPRSDRGRFLARTRYRVPRGRTRPVAVRLGAAALRLLRRAPRRAVQVLATATVAGGRSASRVLVLWLPLHTRRSGRPTVRERGGPLP